MLAALISSLSLTTAHAVVEYRVNDIVIARYREKRLHKLLQKAYDIDRDLGADIFGQPTALGFLKTNLTGYLESFPGRTGAPAAVNFAGVPGVGKSEIVAGLRRRGFPLAIFDAQHYLAGGEKSFAADVVRALRPFLRADEPVILVVEEIDKVAELRPGIAGEHTHQVIATLNQILSQGIITADGDTTSVSNIMVITDMNIAPEWMAEFSGDVLKQPNKSFFDYSHEDLEALDVWLRKDPSAAYKILSRSFRYNTVGRLAPITLLLSPLFEDAYRAIVKRAGERAIQATTAGVHAGKRVEVEIDDALVDFVRTRTTFGPSGARETTLRAGLLFEQLINFAAKVKDEGPSETLNRPRRVHLGVDGDRERALVKVEPLARHGRTLKVSGAFEVALDFDPTDKLFRLPAARVQSRRPALRPSRALARPVSGSKMFESRYPKVDGASVDVSAALARVVHGQDDAIALLKDDVKRYFARPVDNGGKPLFRVFAGFPGIGKSELIVRLAEILDLPLVKIDMAQFVGREAKEGRAFLDDLRRGITEARAKKKRVIVLIEEIDKLVEVNPSDPNPIVLPALAALKSLLNDGVVSLPGSYGSTEIDIRGTLNFLTMNFAVDLFHFVADPRLTSIDDVLLAHRWISMTPMARRNILARIFQPDTISRILPRTHFTRPLNEDAYARIIRDQAKLVTADRFHDEDGRDVGQVELELDPSYLEYLFSEAVIPSEGARNTAVSARALIESHLEDTLVNLPRSSPLARRPVRVTLSFDPKDAHVRGVIAPREGLSPAPRETMNTHVPLLFPPLRDAGPLSVRRIYVAAHEFGHALSRVLLGLRFEHVVVAPPDPSMLGYVRYPGSGPFAPEMVASILSALAGRALERIVLSPDPLSPSSLLSITSGSSADLASATYSLYSLIHLLGLDPAGGSLNRNFTINGHAYGAMQNLPPEAANRLGLILRDLENQILRDLLDVHPVSWFVDKISRLAHEGRMDEHQFYDLVEYPFPGPNLLADGQLDKMTSIRRNKHFDALFRDHLKPPPTDVSSAWALESEAYWDRIAVQFEATIARHLHGSDETDSGPNACTKLLGAPTADRPTIQARGDKE